MSPPRSALTRPGLRLGVLAALMSAFLVGMLVSQALARERGQELVLAVEGYDPRDIVLGHYAQLRTALNTIDLDTVEGDTDFNRHDRIFVTLAVDTDGLARPVAVHRRHPGTGLVAMGRVTDAGQRLQARFNIERYYADRDTALALEDQLRGGTADGGRVRVIVALTGSGQVLIKGFEIDGERQLDRLW